MNWKTLSSEYISRHPYFTARKDTCEMPDGKIVDEYFVVELPVTVCALAITADNKVLMVKQYRHPIGETLVELPGGFIDEKEDPEKAVARELLEETGYEFKDIAYVGKVAANPGVLSGITYLYLARGGTRVAAQQLDDNEEIEILKCTIEEARAMLTDNKMVQALHVCCMLYAFQKLDAEARS